MEKVDHIVTVSEKSIIEAMRLVWERMTVIIGPSSTLPLAAVIEAKIDLRDKKRGIIVSGGNHWKNADYGSILVSRGISALPAI